MTDRPCTCHPDDNPPVPCPQRYALSECRKAAQQEPPQQSAEPVALNIDDAECVMYAALEEAHKRGPVSDDKVLLDELRKRGVILAHAASPVDPARREKVRELVKSAEAILNDEDYYDPDNIEYRKPIREAAAILREDYGL